MRTFEFLLMVAVTIIPFIKRPILRNFKKMRLLLFIGALLAAHFLIEGWRWQMIPGYLVAILLIWRIQAVDTGVPSRISFVKVLGYAFLVIILIPGWALPNLLPVFSLPEPTGEYSVGTHWIHLKTPMDEDITSTQDDKRELMVKAWYPTSAVGSGNRELYVDHGNRLGFINKYGGGLPSSTMNYLDRVKTHVYTDVPIADKQFPVLIFSPGYGSMSTGYYALLTEIASHGYIILNMSHTYESLATTFPDGNVALFDYAYADSISRNSMDDVGALIQAFKDGLPFEERHLIAREAMKRYFVKDQMDRWAQDMIYTVDQLNSWNTSGFFEGKLDLDKIGAFGHSRGGGAAGQLAIKDDRIKAACNLDGLQWGEMIDTLYHIPYLYVSADWPADHEDLASHIYVNKSSDYFYAARILKSAHSNFMDIPLMIPVRALAESGEIDPELAIKITTELTTAFFDKHLKSDESNAPLEVPIRHDLLEMGVFAGDSVLLP